MEMRRTGFEPAHALSNWSLNPARLTTSVPPRNNASPQNVLKCLPYTTQISRTRLQKRMLRYLAYFIVFGLLGWALDTAYRIFAWHEKHGNTYLPYFAIIYGIGGVLLLALYQLTTLNAPAYIFIGGITITILELTAGAFCVNVLGKRMWDYRTSTYNLFGHIDLQHTLYWFIFAAILRILLPQLPV